MPLSGRLFCGPPLKLSSNFRCSTPNALRLQSYMFCYLQQADQNCSIIVFSLSDLQLRVWENPFKKQQDVKRQA